MTDTDSALSRMDRVATPTPDPRIYELARDNEKYVRLKRLAWDEMIRRLETDAESVPDVNLFQFVKETMRLDLAMGKPADADVRAKTQNVLMVINQGGLPLDRQAALLVEAFEKTGGDESIRDALAELVGRDEAEKRLAIEAEVV